MDDQAVRDILTTPSCADIEGATPLSLTDSSALRASLGANPAGVEVYEWQTTRLPAHEIMTPAYVASVLDSLLAEVEGARNRPELEGVPLDEFRAYILSCNSKYPAFFQKAPRLFRMVVSPDFTPDKRRTLMEMVGMSKLHADYNIPLEKRQQHVSMYFREKFMRPARVGEEEEAVAAGTGLRATRITPDHLASDFGTART